MLQFLFISMWLSNKSFFLLCIPFSHTMSCDTYWGKSMILIMTPLTPLSMESSQATEYVVVGPCSCYPSLANDKVVMAYNVLLWLFQIASFLTYLTDVEEGGETMFPFEVPSFCFLFMNALIFRFPLLASSRSFHQLYPCWLIIPWTLFVFCFLL